jgi:hypothetical protein
MERLKFRKERITFYGVNGRRDMGRDARIRIDKMKADNGLRFVRRLLSGWKCQ